MLIIDAINRELGLDVAPIAVVIDVAPEKLQDAAAYVQKFKGKSHKHV